MCYDRTIRVKETVNWPLSDFNTALVQNLLQFLVYTVCRIKGKLISCGHCSDWCVVPGWWRQRAKSLVGWSVWHTSGSLSGGTWCLAVITAYYPHMPIGEVWIYRLRFVCVCLFVCTVTDFSAEDKPSSVKFCTAIHRRTRQRIPHYCELCSPRSPK